MFNENSEYRNIAELTKGYLELVLGIRKGIVRIASSSDDGPSDSEIPIQRFPMIRTYMHTHIHTHACTQIIGTSKQPPANTVKERERTISA